MNLSRRAQVPIRCPSPATRRPADPVCLKRRPTRWPATRGAGTHVGRPEATQTGQTPRSGHRRGGRAAPAPNSTTRSCPSGSRPECRRAAPPPRTAQRVAELVSGDGDLHVGDRQPAAGQRSRDLASRGRRSAARSGPTPIRAGRPGSGHSPAPPRSAATPRQHGKSSMSWPWILRTTSTGSAPTGPPGPGRDDDRVPERPAPCARAPEPAHRPGATVTSRSTNSRAARSSARCLLHMISAPVVKTAPVRRGSPGRAVVERGSVAQRAMRGDPVVTATPTGICTWWWTADPSGATVHSVISQAVEPLLSADPGAVLVTLATRMRQTERADGRHRSPHAPRLRHHAGELGSHGTRTPQSGRTPTS
ncbi:hypothetical protein Ae717Ps2_7224c [Pseudonocardia sp. Ae717_Ps2]|nr:hypothetical protein Ae717Ps2_7224c [Pseudonocardia sp. Ae717_Ps2]